MFNMYLFLQFLCGSRHVKQFERQSQVSSIQQVLFFGCYPLQYQRHLRFLKNDPLNAGPSLYLHKELEREKPLLLILSTMRRILKLNE